MRLQVVSDLHLEFAPIEIYNAGADVLVLAGDICVASYFETSNERKAEWLAFFEATAMRFQHVIYILGNHEHYHGDFDNTIDILDSELGHIVNLYIVDNDAITIGDVLFQCTTLWTDFNRGNMGAKLAVQRGLNDYHLIKRRNRQLWVNDTEAYFEKAIANIEVAATIHNKVVVISHHAPSFRSITEQYKSAGFINYGYYSDLENFIDDRPAIKLWIHGHVHSSHDYQIGDTRVVANPRGYARANRPPENPNFDPNKIYIV